VYHKAEGGGGNHSDVNKCQFIEELHNCCPTKLMSLGLRASDSSPFAPFVCCQGTGAVEVQELYIEMSYLGGISKYKNCQIVNRGGGVCREIPKFEDQDLVDPKTIIL
jgi:hypothetical protein